MTPTMGRSAGDARPPLCAWRSFAAIALGCAVLAASCVGRATTSTPSSPPPKAAPSAAPAVSAVPGPVENPTPWSDTVLYFAIVDRFADGDRGNDKNVDKDEKGTFYGGDLKGLIAQIDEIASLGVTALWITPVVKNVEGFVTGAGFPDWAYHGYWADDFYKVDARFGTEDDLRRLVAECHKRGIRVLLDVVYNHAGYNAQYLTNPATKSWLRSYERGDCGTDDLTSCLSGLPDFRTELPIVADYLMKAHLALAKRTGIDGFRLDTVKHVDHPFWDEHRKRTRTELAPDFFLLGEVWGGDAQSLDPWFAPDEMDAGFDFGFQGSALGFLQGRGRTISFDRYLKSREKVREGHHLAHFLSSHDVKGSLSQLEGNVELFRLAALLQMTTAGIPVVYYGEEVARYGGDWPDNRSAMPWGDRPIEPGHGLARDEALRSDYVKLIAIRKAHKALSRGVHETVSTDGDLLVFARRDAASKDVVVVAVNRGGATAAIKAAAPAEWSSLQSVRDVWNDAAVPLAGGSIEIDVPARSARIVASAP